MRERWPQAREVIYRWSGQVLEPNDYIAFIGRNPDGAENVYMASGDSGQGMTHGTIAGMLLSDLILGRPKRVGVALRSAPRVAPRKTDGAFAKENADVALAVHQGFVTRGDVSSEADIPRGEGRVVRHGLHKVAAYCDETGACTSIRARARISSASCSGTRRRRAGIVPATDRASILTAKCSTGPRSPISSPSRNDDLDHRPFEHRPHRRGEQRQLGDDLRSEQRRRQPASRRTSGAAS